VAARNRHNPALFRYFLFFLAFLIIAGCALEFREKPEETVTGVSEISTTYHTLPNGVRVLVREDHSSPVAGVSVRVNIGAADEGQLAGSGIAHYVEHMFFKGTETRPVGEVFNQVKRAGGYINGFTGYDYTGYEITIPSDNVQVAVDIMVDCLSNAIFDLAEATKEKEVIMNEIRLNRDDPHRFSQKRLWETCYLTHPYKYPVIGYEDLFRKITRDDLIRFYREHYTAENIIISICGDIDSDALIAEIEKSFSPIPRKPGYTTVRPEEKQQITERSRTLEFVTTRSHLNIAYHTTELNHPDLFPLDLAAMILGDGASSRLYRILREEKKLVYTVNAWNYTPKDPGLFAVQAELDEKNLAQVKEIIFAEIERLANGDITDEELERYRKKLIAGYVFRLESVSVQASQLAQDLLLTGDYDFSRKYIEEMKKVTKDDISQAVRQYLRQENLSTVTLIPKKEKSEVPVKEKPALPEAMPVTLLNIRDLRVLVREKHSQPMVTILATAKGGLLTENDKNNGISKLMAALLTSGTKLRSKEDIMNQVEARGGSIGAYSARNSFGISITLLKEDLDFGLKLLAEILIDADFPEEELAKEKEIIKAAIREEETDVYATGSNLLSKTLFRNHPFHLNILGQEESIDRLNRRDVIRHYKTYLRRSNLVLAVYGDIDKASLEKSLRAKLGRVRSGKVKFPEYKKEELITEVRQVSRQMPKEQAVLITGYHGPSVSDKDRYAIEAASAIMSGGGGRLFKRIRDEAGLSYVIGAYPIFGLDTGTFIFYLATSKEKIEEARSLLIEEIDKLVALGVTEAELKKAKASLIGAKKISRQTNYNIAFENSLDELYGLGAGNYLKYEENINAITLDDIKQISAKYFKKTNYAIIRILP